MDQLEQKILAGTSKGLVVFTNKKDWRVAQVHFTGFPVSFVFVDNRTQTWWVGLAHRHWGQKMHRSVDQGRSWEQVATPVYPEGTVIKSGKPASLKKIWCMAHGGEDRPGLLYIGTEPGGLFVSQDNGDHFHLAKPLWEHPSRKHEWFGAGRDYPFIHSIIVDPRDSNHYYVAISCAGVFETKDDGNTWRPTNKGLIATYLPNPNIEVGHDPHLVLACQSNPDVLWQQNHCGIFRSINAGKHWENVTGKSGFPNYGFALAIDHSNPDRAWVIPATSDTMRVAPDLALCVCETNNGGKSWQPIRKGLPQDHCFDIVFRHSFANKGPLMAFGTSTGNVFLSQDEGQSWETISSTLARVDALTFA